MSNLHYLTLDKVTTGTCYLASAILNFAESATLDKMQSSIQFNWRWILLLINGISSDIQKLLKYFNGTTIFVFSTKLFLLLTWVVFPTGVALYVND